MLIGKPDREWHLSASTSAARNVGLWQNGRECYKLAAMVVEFRMFESLLIQI